MKNKGAARLVALHHLKNYQEALTDYSATAACLPASSKGSAQHNPGFSPSRCSSCMSNYGPDF